MILHLNIILIYRLPWDLSITFILEDMHFHMSTIITIRYLFYSGDCKPKWKRLQCYVWLPKFANKIEGFGTASPSLPRLVGIEFVQICVWKKKNQRRGLKEQGMLKLRKWKRLCGLKFLSLEKMQLRVDFPGARKLHIFRGCESDSSFPFPSFSFSLPLFSFSSSSFERKLPAIFKTPRSLLLFLSYLRPPPISSFLSSFSFFFFFLLSLPCPLLLIPPPPPLSSFPLKMNRQLFFRCSAIYAAINF